MIGCSECSSANVTSCRRSPTSVGWYLFAARRRRLDAVEQPSGPEQSRTEAFHSRGESAVGGHDGRCLARGEGSPCLLDYRVVSLAHGMHDLDSAHHTLRHTAPGLAFEDKYDAWRKHGGIEEPGVQAGGCRWTIVPPSVGSRSDDIRAVDH